MTTTGPRSAVGVRGVVRADLLEVFDIEKRSFPQPWPYAAFEQFLECDGFLVAIDDDTVIGYVVADSVSNYGATIGHIKDLAVHPDRRGEGIGRTLLARALTKLHVEGVDRVKLEVRAGNEAAQALYEAFDFERHHVMPGYYDDGEDAYVMVREA